MEREKFRYFCYACDKQFETTFEASSCCTCDSCAIQERKGEQANTQKFEVYRVSPPQNHNRTIGVLSSGIGPRNQPLSTVVSFTSTMLSGPNFLSGFPEGTYLGNLIRQLMRQGNGITAATEQQIKRLQKVEGVKQCSVCQSGNQEEQMQQQENSRGFKLGCGHTFHEDCIRPWFQRTNTCPVCRKAIN